MNIGVFDSGLGGLNVLKEIVRVIPEYNYVYLGDNARTPYGNRSHDAIYEFTKEAVDFLFTEKQCQLVIIACNTASSEALRRIQQEWLFRNFSDRRVLGVIRPVVEFAAESAAKRIGVIGTKGTIESGAYVREVRKINPLIKVIQEATPLLVPLIEEGITGGRIVKKLVKDYLAPLQRERIDSLILGCTHYPIISEAIQKAVGKKVRIFHSGEIVARSLENYLYRHSEIEKSLNKDAGREFLVTELSPHYERLMGEWFGKEYPLQKITL